LRSNLGLDLLRDVDKETLDAVLAEKSLRNYVKLAWPIVEPGTRYVDGWHIGCICEHLEAVSRGELLRLIINIPPRHMKSLTVSVFWPTWEWIWHSPMRFLFASYAESLSIRDAIKSRRLIQSAWYQRWWGERYALTGDQNQKSRYENDNTGLRLASSVGGSITGEGGDRIVADDPHNVQEAESDIERTKTITWWDEVMSTRLNDPVRSAMVVVMQRVHEDDLTGHLMERGDYHHLCLPAEYEPKIISYARDGSVEESDKREPQPHHGCGHGSDPRTQKGQLLWPDRFTPEAIERLKIDLGPYAAAGQLQQRPVARGGAIFKDEWFQRPPEGWYNRPHVTVQFWDLAFSKKETADYTAACTLEVDAKKFMNLSHMLCERFAVGDLSDKIAEHINTLKPNYVGIEVGAYKQAITRDIMMSLYSKVKTPCVIIPIPVDTDKVTRAYVAANRAQNGFVYADKDLPWWKRFVRVLLRFPKVSNDDEVDAFSGAVAMAIEHVDVEAPAKSSYSMGDLGDESRSSMLQEFKQNAEVIIVGRSIPKITRTTNPGLHSGAGARTS
jgi:predicted phage terminase large subunit-like protein